MLSVLPSADLKRGGPTASAGAYRAAALCRAKKNGSLKPVSNFHCSFRFYSTLALILKLWGAFHKHIIQHFKFGLQADYK